MHFEIHLKIKKKPLSLQIRAVENQTMKSEPMTRIRSAFSPEA